MAGRLVNLDSKFGITKCVKRYHDDDFISLLPDDILLDILSSLPLKEAGRTSVLSSRWRYLWSYTSYLNFDDYSTMEKIIQDPDLCLVEREREKYVRWVDSVLQSHRGFSLKEFRICFTLIHSPSITKWLEFAFERHIEKLELNLRDGEYIHGPDETYVFPQELLRDNSRIFNYKTIKVLCLDCVNVSGEAIEFLLRYCPLLEQLVVCFSELLSSLEVCGPSLVLKHLKIWDCKYLKSLRISAPNLTTLILDKIEGILLEDVPMLLDVYVAFGDSLPDSMHVQRLVPTLLCCFSQLEILTLNIYGRKELLSTPDFPVMPKLKKLVFVKVLCGVDWSLLDLAHFITASPNLQEFELKQQIIVAERSNREIQKGVEHFPLHQHLNVFRFLGYYGCPSDVELVNYLLENCLALKEIIVDTQPPDPLAYEPVDPEELKLIEIAKIYAKQQLEPLVPKHISLFIC
ncbi:F-box/FBD/LRR-repeat protein [Striga hermonthica]|uniref:F-box/FBD/LRR-repeat protein n=1 Tax=Striga hermonthica TaxID=68872 RepID=A0A9N7MI64_STRHE|nr:F-box/FBD/LRR-repeat protein [Striga hermonthica]